jgi:hypothetical protein
MRGRSPCKIGVQAELHGSQDDVMASDRKLAADDVLTAGARSDRTKYFPGRKAK